MNLFPPEFLALQTIRQPVMRARMRQFTTPLCEFASDLITAKSQLAGV
jgi:hypothetical protein